MFPSPLIPLPDLSSTGGIQEFNEQTRTRNEAHFADSGPGYKSPDVCQIGVYRPFLKVQYFQG
jgi:hypothetical protein